MSKSKSPRILGMIPGLKPPKEPPKVPQGFTKLPTDSELHGTIKNWFADRSELMNDRT